MQRISSILFAILLASGCASEGTDAPPRDIDAGVDAAVGCGSDLDCDDGNECTDEVCDLATGLCSNPPVSVGTPLAIQTAGDCVERQCDGAGGLTDAADDGDLADDGNDCTVETCSGGTPGSSDAAAGSACAAGLCDGAGTCVGCLDASDCGTDTACLTYECNLGACGMQYAGAGTPLPVEDQSAGDCQRLECDGVGAPQGIADDSDVPADEGNECTVEACLAGSPQLALVGEGTSCTFGGGQVCSALGGCVECNEVGDCAVDACTESAACDANTCNVTSYTNQAAAVGVQTPGDCQQVWCDGSGATVQQDDDFDRPADLDYGDCVTTTCSSGTPVYDLITSGTDCSLAPGYGYCQDDGICGECYRQLDCLPYGGEAGCTGGWCEMVECDPGWFDTDQRYDNECEAEDSSVDETNTLLGSASCSDSSSAQDFMGIVASDLLFVAPDPTLTGAAKDHYLFHSTGGACQNDIDFTLVVLWSSDPSCYRLVIDPVGAEFYSCSPSGMSSCTISQGSGSYDDDEDILITVEKTCAASELTERMGYQVQGHF